MSRLSIALTRPAALGAVASVAGWAAVAVMVLVVVTIVAGVTGHRVIAAAQSLTPYLLAASVPLAIAALVGRRWGLAAIAGAVAVTFVALTWPLLRPPPQPSAAAADATPLRVFHANLLVHNDRHDEIVDAVGRVDADVLAFAEYTPEFAATWRASPVAAGYPYRLEHSEVEGHGAALWSRYPLIEIERSSGGFTHLTTTVAAPQTVVIKVAHVTSPIVDTGDWRRDLRSLRGKPDTEAPVMIVGDLNASWWHPEFRRLLDAGWTDAHRAVGRGFSSSWPNHARLVPRFVRLDHALVDDGLHVSEVVEVDIPGSDHTGFVVTVAAVADG